MGKIDIFEQFERRNPIFTNKEFLNPSYIPENFPYRDAQLKSLGAGLEPLIRKEEPTDFLLYGKEGEGKSSGIRIALDQLRRKVPSTAISHVTGPATSEYSVITTLANSFLREGEKLAMGGSMSFYYSMLERCLRDTEGPAVIVLHCIDSLNGKTSDMLKGIKRIKYETKRDLSIIAIADQRRPDIKTIETFPSTEWEHVEFEPYTLDQFRDIVQNRAKLAFENGVLTRDASELAMILGESRDYNVAYALALLKRAGSIASNRNAPNILASHVEEAHGDKKEMFLERMISGSTDTEKLLLKAIAEVAGNGTYAKTSEITSRYAELTYDIDPRRITGHRNVISVMRHFLDQGIVASRQYNGGRRGRSKEFLLTADKNQLTKLLEKYPIKP